MDAKELQRWQRKRIWYKEKHNTSDTWKSDYRVWCREMHTTSYTECKWIKEDIIPIDK